MASWPAGLDTPLGEDGARLSGGEASRIALARALLRRAPLLVVDEPTAHLDPATADAVRASLVALRGTTTILAISHDPRLADAADRVLVLERGRVLDRRPCPPTHWAAGHGRRRHHPRARGRAPMSPERRLLGLLVPVRRDAVLGALLAAATLLVGMALIGSAAYLISRAAISTLFVEVAVLVAVVRGFAIARAALRYAERYVTHRATLGLLATLRARTFRALEPRLPALAASSTTGDLLARLGPDIDAMDRFYLGGIVPPFAAVVAGVAAVVVLALAAPAAGVVLAIGLLAAGVVAPVLGRRAARAGAGAPRRADARASMRPSPTTSPARPSSSRSRRRPGSMPGSAGRPRPCAGPSAGRRGSGARPTGPAPPSPPPPRWSSSGSPSRSLRPARSTPSCSRCCRWWPLAAFEGVQPLASSMDQLEESRAAATRVFELADAPLPVADPARHRGGLPPTAWTRRCGGPGCRARSASPSATRRTRRRSSRDCRRRSPAAGASRSAGRAARGSRRSSTCWSGSGRRPAETIRLGGLDVATLAGDAVRAGIAVVPQRPYLFHGTLRDNLLVADGDATDDELLEALAFAGLEGSLATPAGLGTILGEDGMRLSGGERERVAIARMVLKDAPVVVLDEATAHLDLDAEQALVGRLDDYLRGRTAIILAHRSALLDLATERVTL